MIKFSPSEARENRDKVFSQLQSKIMGKIIILYLSTEYIISSLYKKKLRKLHMKAVRENGLEFIAFHSFNL